MTARRSRLLLCALAVAAWAPAADAGAVGPPLPSAYSGKEGAVAPGGTERLIARSAGAGTAVTAVSRADGRVLRSRRIRGDWSVPAVTIYGGTTGLSADGGTLVLARPTNRFPPASTRLAVLDATTLRVRRRVELRGFFTVDAISPDGRRLYLVQYADSVLEYAVRVLDTRSGRLARRHVVDPRKPDEQMGGLPMTRATSRDGRWVYTLYAGGAETFIHALDTVGATAACIDLEMLPPDSDLSTARLRVSADGRRIEVRRDRRLVATVDARTFAVSEPGAAERRAGARGAVAARPAARRAVDPPVDGGGFPWPLVPIVGGLAGLCALAMVRRAPRGHGA